MPNSSDFHRSAAPRRFDYSVQQLLTLTLIPLLLSSTAPASFAAQPIRPAAVVAAPTFSPVAGTYTSPQSVTIGSATSGASIRYTTNGSTPSPTSGTLYSGPVAVNVNTTIKAIAYKSGMTNSSVTTAAYTITVAAPSFNPAAGTYSAAQSVAIGSATSGASIRYTTNGSTPSPTSGTLYSGPVAVNVTTTLKAIAYKSGMANSSVSSATYTISTTVAAPTFSPGAGAYAGPQAVTLSSATSGASIRYTTDGSTPSQTAGTLYSTPVAVSATTTIKAIAYKSGLTDSTVSSATYTIAVAAPTFSPAGGSYTSTQTVTLASATSGASIRYTTDGSTPSQTVGTLYSTPVTVSANTTIKAIAYKTGLADSTVSSATYMIAVAAPTFTPAAGTYGSDQTVTLASATTGATIRYTTDGSTPSQTAGTLYSAPVAVTITTTIKAIAYKSGMANSTVSSATYTMTVAAPTFSPAAGTYSTTQTVTLSTATSGASIRYTTNGSTPSPTSGTLYSTPFTVSATTTVKAIAYKTGMTSSNVVSALYTIAPAAAAPTFTPAAGTYLAAQNVTLHSATYGATIRYTTDGTDPSQTVGTVYSAAIPVGVTTTIKAIAYKSGMTNSSISSALYTINLPVAAPTFNPPDGYYSAPQSVTITSATPGATIRYTTIWNYGFDRGAPTRTSGTLYAWPIAVPGSSVQIKAIAYKDGMPDSAVSTASYTVSPPANGVEITPRQVMLLPSQRLTLSDLRVTVPGEPVNWVSWTAVPDNVGTLDGSEYVAPATFAPGQIVQLVATSNNPAKSGTLLVFLTSHSRLNSGGDWYADPLGNVWSGEAFPMGCSDYGNPCWGISTGVVADSSTPEYLLMERCVPPVWQPQLGKYFKYSYQLANGLYDVALHFAADPNEPGYASASVWTAGNFLKVVDVADAVAEAGGPWQTFDRQLTANVIDNSIAFGFYNLPVSGIEVRPAGVVEVGPAKAALGPLQTQQFTAVGGAVRWSIDPPDAGTLRDDGLYTAPASGTVQTASVTATSLTDPANSFTAQVYLLDHYLYDLVFTGVSPAVVSLNPSQPLHLNAVGNTAVTWSISPTGIGTLTEDGIYTAPAVVDSPSSLTVTATSRVGPPLTFTAQINLVPRVSIAMTPATALLVASQQQQFSVVVTGNSNTAVVWSIAPEGVGSISANGLYQAPATVGAPQTVTVTATSVADGTASASAQVSLVPAISVALTPPAVSLPPSQQQQFTAVVTNLVNGNAAVTWTLTPMGVGSIGPGGLYTAPATFTGPQSLTVIATSQADPSKTASATVTLTQAPVSIAVAPATVALYAGQPQQFTATVANTGNTGVTWALNPNIGNLANGLYTAPASISVQQTITLFATSQADTSKIASATITLLPAPSGALQLAPNTGQAGHFLHVSILGQNTHFVQGQTQAQFGPGIQVGGGIAGAFGPVTVTSPTTAIAQVSTVPNAMPGSRAVTLQTGSETVSLANGFATTGIPAGNSFSPNSAQPGQSLSVAVNGVYTNFVQGITQVSFGPGISVGAVTVTSPTALTAQITVDPNAPLGPRTPIAQTGLERAALAGGFSVLGTITGPPPTLSISGPLESAVVTEPTPVTGTVTSPNLAYWTLEFKPADVSTWSQFASGNTPAVSATFDPTQLLNGATQLRLTALDTSGQAAATTSSVIVSGNQKVGLFTLAYVDLSIPMGGMPIQVIRTYDSRNKSAGDFGAGWTLGIKSARLTANRPIGDGWQGTFQLAWYCIDPSRPHTVSVTMPNGELYTFEATLTNNCDLIASPSPTLGFTPVGTTPPNASLTMVGIDHGAVQTSYPYEGPTRLLDLDAVSLLDPDQYILGIPDGRQLLLSQQNGLQSITDLNGNKVTFTPDEIRQSNGQSVAFARDAQGRVTSVTDPAGKQIAYTYDDAGNLANVKNQADEVSSYSYDCTHLLVGITDPRRVTPIRNEYYPDGRLKSHTDAYGQTINYVHGINARQEIVTDRLGRITLNEYDAAGNIVLTTDAAGGTTTRTFDARNNVLTQTDPLGRTTTYTYDASNNRLTETDPLGNTATYTYDGYNRLLTLTDALGRVTTTNVYDANGNLTSTRDAAGGTTSYTYNAQGLPLSVTDPLGGLTAYQYDGFGCRTQQTDALGHVTSYTYDAWGAVLTQTATRTTPSGPEALVTTYQYDDLNRRIQTTDPDGSTTGTAYDPIGDVATRTDKLGRQTTYVYDQMGSLLKTTFPDGATQQSTSDAEGNVLTSTDRAGRITTYAYDGVNRRTTTTLPDGAIERTAYDLAGQVTSETDALGNQTQYTYDAAGRRTRTTDALGQITTYAYDAVGNRLSFTDARGNTARYEYDALNRRVKATYPDNTFDLTAYDALGRDTSKTDQASRLTQYSYDAMGRLLQVTDALNQVTKYAYDGVGNRISQTDTNNHVTISEFDKMGRRTKRTLPLGMADTAVYDAASNLTSRTDFRGKTTTYEYDTMNRLLTKTPDPSLGEPLVRFTYTLSGRRASMVDASGTTTYSYDSRDRLLTKTAPQGTLTYTRDTAGNLLSVRSSNPDGTTVDYAYDSLNRLSTVRDNRLASGVTTYSYDPVGNLGGVQYPNGVQSTYTYDSLNRLTNLAVANGAALASYAYSLGAVGNRLTLTEATGRQVTYAYDVLYRLTGEAITGDPDGANGSVTYTLDPVGNRLARTSSLAPVPSSTNTYDANDRLEGSTYDLNGSPTSADGKNYAYDFENRLTQAGATTVVYDGDGNRVAVTSGGVTTAFLVDTVNPTGLPQVLEELAGGTVQRVYTYGATRISQSQILNGAWTTHFYGYDGHGSVRFLTDTAGAITDRYIYDAFGNQLAASGTTPNLYRYVSEPFDQALQMTYLRARYMNPASGRFWTMDTYEGASLDPLSLHKYLYAGCDPVNKADPSGQIALPLAIGAGILAGLTIFGLIYWSVAQGRAMGEGRDAHQTAEAMIQAALRNLHSTQPVLRMKMFLRSFMGKFNYLNMVDPEDAAKQLALVTDNFSKLAQGVQHKLAFLALPFPSGDKIAASIRGGPYIVVVSRLFSARTPEEQARTVIHELCHIALGFGDMFYGDVSDFELPNVLAVNPDTYSYYAMFSWEGQGP